MIHISHYSVPVETEGCVHSQGQKKLWAEFVQIGVIKILLSPGGSQKGRHSQLPIVNSVDMSKPDWRLLKDYRELDY
jgi:hypothetical protein